ncbi:hypothetical protein CHH28_02245 [Bacterioplanes sanyensis]|uniref:Lipoprotein n=1 Tax=Bacterioplanes sanyensis TaxID=1249553 RepID=A0A222FEQ4_9GAMM|nr:hypothetical protein [Bacterioplanes sanyensis]ASP37565.1 hypothetical protein CHH28_02245 [Bacterioplanes sanyensis]
MKNILIALSLTLLSACGSDSSSKDSNSPTTTAEPPATSTDQPTESTDDNTDHNNTSGDLVSLTDTNKSDIIQLSVNDDGSWCYISRTSDDKESLTDHIDSWAGGWHQSLHCHDQQESFTHIAEDGQILVDVITSDRDTIFLLKAVKEGIFDYSLHLSQLNQAGQVVQQRALIDTPDAHDLLYYSRTPTDISVETFADLHKDNKPIIKEGEYAKLEWKNDNLFLLAKVYGLTLYELNKDLSIGSSHQIIPGFSSVVDDMDFSISKHGKVAVAYSFDKVSLPIINKHFNDHLTDDISDMSSTIVTVLDMNSQSSNRFVDSIPDNIKKLAGIEWQGEKLMVVSNALRRKGINGTEHQDIDAIVATYNVTSAIRESTESINLDKHDYVQGTTLDSDNSLILYGSSGYRREHDLLRKGHGIVYRKTDQSTEIMINKSIGAYSTISDIHLTNNKIYYIYRYSPQEYADCDLFKDECGFHAGIAMEELN